MGARWYWHAVCHRGHQFSNFSGGSDGVCETEGCDSKKILEIACAGGPFSDKSICKKICWPALEKGLPLTTHWDDCWTDHHECAIAKILKMDLGLLRKLREKYHDKELNHRSGWVHRGETADSQQSS